MSLKSEIDKIVPPNMGIPYVPEHYQPFLPIEEPQDYLAIAKAYGLSPEATQALKYLLRHGRKPPYGEPYLLNAIKDLIKCVEMTYRQLNRFLEEAATRDRWAARQEAAPKTEPGPGPTEPETEP